jgi:histone deacetylase 1/2
MKATLNDFEIKFKNVPLFCDNKSVVKLTNNPVHHARTKYIDVCHYFIRDHQQKENISIENISTEDQLADIFTKPLDEKRFCKLRIELNIFNFSNMCCAPPLIWHASPSSYPR